jgi:DNA-binding NtrC family response regulator
MALTIPPLRERPSEIELLARIFVERFAHELGRRSPPQLTTSSIEYLNAHSWPGNVRELRNVIQRSVLMSFDVSEIRPEHMLLGEVTSAAIPLEDSALGARSHGGNAARAEQATGVGEPSASAVRVASTAAGERERIIDALAQCAGNQTQAAKLLGIGRTKLVERLREYELPRPRKHEPSGRLRSTPGG